jgi:hypothetical protein
MNTETQLDISYDLNDLETFWPLNDLTYVSNPNFGVTDLSLSCVSCLRVYICIFVLLNQKYLGYQINGLLSRTNSHELNLNLL